MFDNLKYNTSTNKTKSEQMEAKGMSCHKHSLKDSYKYSTCSNCTFTCSSFPYLCTCTSISFQRNKLLAIYNFNYNLYKY